MSFIPQKTGTVGQYDVMTQPRFTPEQMQLFSQMMGMASPSSFTGRLAQGDQGLFSQMEAPAERQFAQALGGLGSRFSGMGTGARSSSGAALAGAGLGTDLAQSLQAQRLGLQRQAIGDLMGMGRELLSTSPYNTFLQPTARPWWQEALLGGAQGLAQGLPMMMATGNPMAMLGSALAGGLRGGLGGQQQAFNPFMAGGSYNQGLGGFRQ